MVCLGFRVKRQNGSKMHKSLQVRVGPHQPERVLQALAGKRSKMIKNPTKKQGNW